MGAEDTSGSSRENSKENATNGENDNKVIGEWVFLPFIANNKKYSK
jgi:hypothetical protein